MSARLSLQQTPIVKWKGKTFNQLVSSIKKNKNSSEANTLFARAQPTKHYRREIATTADEDTTGSVRTSTRIDIVNAPGTAIVNSAVCTADSCTNGLNQTLDFNLTENKSDRPCYPSDSDSATVDFDVASFARRRCRSSGVISKKARPGTVNDSYNTSNAQYLESRGLTFKQNQYNFIREGDRTAIPGDVMSMNNIYVGNNISNYPKLLISEAKGNNQFQYEWLDENTYTITFEDGYYNDADLTKYIHHQMNLNGHFYRDSAGAAFYLIDMYYSSYNKEFIITCKVTSTTIHSDYTAANSSWSIPIKDTVPCVIIYGGFTNVIGVPVGTYPSTRVEYQNYTYSSNQTTVGTNPEIRPAYKPIYYKPNNIEFAQQGGVTASERIARIKYNTITTAGSTFRSAYGAQTANAYSYGVHPTGTLSSLKWKLGYPLTKVPVINKLTGELCCGTKPSAIFSTAKR